MTIAVIDSGGANIASVMFALERVGAQSVFTDDIDIIATAEKVILPGVGAAKDAMAGLQEKGLVDVIQSLTQPVLGICLGMQLLFEHSEEGDVEMLGLIKGSIKHFAPEQNKTIPHMGWNTVELMQDHPLVHGIPDLTYYYFVHSYFAPVTEATLGKTDYGAESFAAMVAQGNIMGCQYHPECSSKAGSNILKNFVEMT